MKLPVACRVRARRDKDRGSRMKLHWSQGAAYFNPYEIAGDELARFRRNAKHTRELLFRLVASHLPVGSGRDRAAVGRICQALAQKGRHLYNDLLPKRNPVAKEAREWLEGLSREGRVESLQIVCDRSPWFVPWNLIYAGSPPGEADFVSDDKETLRAAFEPFWGIRHNLCGGLRVNPLQLTPLPERPRTLFVIDPGVRESLAGHVVNPERGVDQRMLLEQFLEGVRQAWPDVREANSRGELEKALAVGRPDLMYWLCHADPGALWLGKESVTIDDLSDLLGEFDADGRTNGLVILNACRTAQEAKGLGSFLKVFSDWGYCGLIATEERTINHFANLFGLAILRGLLEGRHPVGHLTWLTRSHTSHIPLGLIYGTYCPPDLRIGPMAVPNAPAGETASPAPEDFGSPNLETMEGCTLLSPPGGTDGDGWEAETQRRRRWPDLPPARPYLPLEMYGPEHRALFSGRDADIARFTMLLAQEATRVLVLHGESGVGKSSFLRAGVIPYLEDECVGFRFLRSRDGNEDDNDQEVPEQPPVVFIRATDDPVGQLAQELWAYCRQPLTYRTPTGRPVPVDLPGRLTRAVGAAAGRYPTIAEIRDALVRDPARIQAVLETIAHDLPFSLVVVLDQAEEMFTLVDPRRSQDDRDEGPAASRDAMLEALRRMARRPGDFKVIVSLRTEFCGRLLDRLRRGVAANQGIREYMLTELDEEGLVEALERPTRDRSIRYSDQIPHEVYRFSYAKGVALRIAKEIRQAGHRDSILPLAQFLGDQLYRRARDRAPNASVVTDEDFAAIGGVEGGLRTHLERQIRQLADSDPHEEEAITDLLGQLVHRQLDGTHSTDLVRESDLRDKWSGRRSFDEVLMRAESLRLVRFSTRRRDDGAASRSISLGHDAMALVIEAWRLERQRREQEEQARRKEQERQTKQRERRDQETRERLRRIWNVAVFVIATVVVIFGVSASWLAYRLWQSNQALEKAGKKVEENNDNLKKAYRTVNREAEEARSARRLAAGRLAAIELIRADSMWRREPKRTLEILRNTDNIPLRERDFAWGHLVWLCRRSAQGRHTLLGHNGAVNVVDFSRDGAALASASWDGTVRIWDAATGQDRRTLRGHEGPVRGVAFSRDGALASASDDGTVKIWDAATGHVRRTLRGHGGVVNAVAFSPDGAALASASSDGTVKIWDPATGNPRLTLRGRVGDFAAVAFSRDGATLASACYNGSVKLWDAATGLERLTLRGHEASVTAVAFSRDGAALASVSWDRTIRIWDAARPRLE